MNKGENKKSLENALEVVLTETPDVLSSLIRTAVSEFKYEDLGYWSIEETKSKSPTYRKILIGIIHIVDDYIESEDCIGILTLQSLGSDKTLLRIPPRKNWHINIEPETLPFLGEENISRISNDKFYWFYSESYFARLLERLFTEFQRLGFIDFKKEKPPIGFKASQPQKE